MVATLLRPGVPTLVDIWKVLLDVVILLGAGAVLGALLERLRQSAILGYLLAGALLGPHGLHVVRSGDEVLAVSELGVAMLLFAIGLEFSWSRLRALGRTALGGGVVQVLATTAVGAGAAALAGLGGATGFVVGAMCALSSTACVLRVLTAQGEMESVHGERALGILLVQDMAVVPFVLVVAVLAGGGTPQEILLGIGRTTGIGLALVAGLYLLFHWVVPWFLSASSVQSNRELPLLAAVVSGLGSGVVAHAVGVSPALGTFVAGMLLAESPFAVQVRADIQSLKNLLLTLFFTAVGMLANPAWIAAHAGLVTAAVVTVVIGKSALVWVSLRLFGTTGRTALAAGLCLGQIGEFSFVLAGLARGTLLSEQLFLLVVSTTVITMFLSPYLVTFAPRWSARLVGRPGQDSSPVPGADQEERLGIVLGFGPAGRAAAERVAECGVRVVVVDQNPQAAEDARALGHHAVTGDARYAEVLDHAGLGRASVLVVTVPSTDTALQVVRYVRQQAPEVLVLVRARFHRALPDLQAAGAHAVIDEEVEVGRRVATTYEDLMQAALKGSDA